jgi:F0F1-type ATP synthase assembly protein I
MYWWNMKLVELTVGDVAAVLLGLGAGIFLDRLFTAPPC